MKKNLLYFLLLVILFSCKTQKQTPYYSNPSALFDKEKFANNPGKWDFYIHDSQGATYKTRSESIVDSSFEAVLNKTYPIEVPDALKRNELHRKKEVHVYVKDSSINNQQRSQIKKEDIVEVVSFVNPEKLEQDNQNNALKIVKSFLGFLAVILGAIIAICFIVYISVEAFFEALFDSIFGCYIATMAYGSYDAAEVKILRRFRDEKLKKTFLGRVFIVNYYTFSPLLVKVLKNMGFINRLIRKRLDRFVISLKTKNGW